jgi:hypothetical protein
VSTKSLAPEPVRTVTTAARVTPAHASILRRATCACGRPIVDGGECAECRSKRLQRAAMSGASVGGGVPSSVHSTLRSPGLPLDSGTRTAMESRFGHDFSHVRVHHDAGAAMSAHDVGARAYTVGQDVVFGAGHYAPDTSEGQHLLAHELAHTLQQRGLQRAPDHINTDQGAEYNRLEREAESIAAAAMQGGPVILPRSAPGAVLSRKLDDGNVDKPSGKKKGKKKITVASAYMTTSHTVTPVEAFERTEGKTKAIRRVESFDVDQLFVPGTKGPNALDAYTAMAGKGLEATLNVDGRTKAVLWQKRDDTAGLQSRWLKGVGWPGGQSADALWEKCGGDKTFPCVDKVTCQMDHIVELQVGGNNTDENIQALDPEQNRDSGGAIKNQVFKLAETVIADTDLSDGSAEQINLKFGKATAMGTPEKLPTKCPPSKPTCLSVENCARKGAAKASAAGNKANDVVDYEISAGGGAPTVLKVPTDFSKKKKGTVQIKDDSLNNSSAELIPGLLLNVLSHKPAGGDQIEGEIDTREKTRLPLALEGKSGGVHFNVGKDGKLTLATKNPNLAFTYRYLSPGKITSVSLNDGGGVDWAGNIHSGVPFIGAIDIAYSKGELKVSKGIDPATLKKKSLLGARITTAELSLLLAPEFKPEGRLEFQMGPEKTPLMTGYVKVGKDDAGLLAEGKIKLNIPKIDTAEFDLVYRAAGEKSGWTIDIKIESSQIKLPYVKGGSLTGHIAREQMDFSGKVNFELPGGNTAEAELKRQGNDWIFIGSGTFKFPKLDDTKVGVSYNTSTETFIAWGSTGFTISSIGLKGHLEKVTFVAKKGDDLKVSGTGSLEIKKGKANGSAKVTLHESGKFSGKGHIQYQFTENITADAEVELDENEKLRVTGELTLKRYELFKGHHDQKQLLDINLPPIPIPALSVGGAGVNIVIGGGISAGYDFGPGVIEPLTFSAGFNPLENDPDLDLKVGGQVKIPVAAHLTASIHAGIELSITIAKVEGGIQIDGTIALKGGLNAEFKARYYQKKFEANLTPELDVELLLRLALTAYVLAQAGWGWLKVSTRKDWKLLEREIPTGVRLQVSAPFGYSSDKGITLPSADQITVKKPNIDVPTLLNNLFGNTSPSEKEV